MYLREIDPLIIELEELVPGDDLEAEIETPEWGYCSPMPGVRYFGWLRPGRERDSVQTARRSPPAGGRKNG